MRLSIASTFTCNPIEDTLKFWSEKFGFKTVVRFSPYDQVFQELLNQHSSLNHPDNDARLVFVKFDDWIRNLTNTDESSIHSHIAINIQSICEYAATSASYVKSPLFLTIAQNSRDSIIKPENQTSYEQLIKHNLAEHSNIFVTTSREMNMKYSVDDYYDAQRDQLGHIPYKREYFTALATNVFRKVLADKRKPYKVVVLDCDNTLWGGVCGEVGSKGVTLSEPYRNLQLFMLQQVKSGKILCLCSKNVQEDVDSVFSERPDMIISEKDIVRSKINWQPKSQNIKKLSEELNLGLDSFIFVDDNPVECAEVRANCPEVLTLNMPGNPEEMASFLDHVWPFDFLKSANDHAKDSTHKTPVNQNSMIFEQIAQDLNSALKITQQIPSNGNAGSATSSRFALSAEKSSVEIITEI